MIISASYKTDIPAFYARWFMYRLEAGFCGVRNPYSGRISRVDLSPSNVDAFVFWTKNAGPFLSSLQKISGLGYPFVVQYTINGYPKELESHVVKASRSIKHAKCIAERHGPDAVVWRYDTIILSSLTPPDYHIENFSRIAQCMVGITNEVVISFAQTYKKTRHNLDVAAAASGFTWEDPPGEIKVDLVRQLSAVAAEVGIQLTVCAQPEYITQGAREAICIDIARLNRIASRPLMAPIHGNRTGCACHKSVDIGDYDTCPHGCVYCYAVRNQKLAISRFRQHDPRSATLFGKQEIAEELGLPTQLTLF